MQCNVVEATAVSLIAIVVTILRISYRIHRKLAWWDDLLVGMAACFLVLLLIGVWLSTAGECIFIPIVSELARVARIVPGFRKSIHIHVDSLLSLFRDVGANVADHGFLRIHSFTHHHHHTRLTGIHIAPQPIIPSHPGLFWP